LKIRKPNDEKFFKDIVLNDILDEISSETGVSSRNSRKPKKKKIFIKVFFLIFITIALVWFSIVLFKLVSDATTLEKPVPKTTEIQEHDTQEWKMQEDRKEQKNNIIVLPNITPKAIEKKPVQTSKSHVELFKKPKVKIVPKVNPERKVLPLNEEAKQALIRKNAKEALKQQMLN